jgi:hypothetical protein
VFGSALEANVCVLNVEAEQKGRRPAAFRNAGCVFTLSASASKITQRLFFIALVATKFVEIT